MALEFKYVGVGATPFSVDLVDVVRLGSIDGLTEMADHLAVGSSSVVIDDPDGTVGNAGDAILGLQLFTVDETDCPAGNQRLYTGYIGTREYGRPEIEKHASARSISVQLYDLNAIAGFRVIPRSDAAANRPAEEVGERLTWILGSAYLTGLLADNGLVTYPATTMTAADYRGQRPVQVINDCELAGRYFAFVYPDETEAVLASLFFDNANTSTAYVSDIFLTNDLSLADGVNVFLVEPDFKLRRSPDDVGSGVFLPYRSGSVFRTRAATADIYGDRDLIAPNANVGTSAKAQDEADDFLEEHATEEDTITGTVKLPPAAVNRLRAGHRVGVLLTHCPGYESWTWLRCTQRSPGQQDETNAFYTVPLVLSPQEGFAGDPPEPPSEYCDTGTWADTNASGAGTSITNVGGHTVITNGSLNTGQFNAASGTTELNALITNICAADEWKIEATFAVAAADDNNHTSMAFSLHDAAQVSVFQAILDDDPTAPDTFWELFSPGNFDTGAWDGFTPGESYNVRVEGSAAGNFVRIKVWNVLDAEPGWLGSIPYGGAVIRGFSIDTNGSSLFGVTTPTTAVTKTFTSLCVNPL